MVTGNIEGWLENEEKRVETLRDFNILDISCHHFSLFHLDLLIPLTLSHLSLPTSSPQAMIEFYESSEYLSINHQASEKRQPLYEERNKVRIFIFHTGRKIIYQKM